MNLASLALAHAPERRAVRTHDGWLTWGDVRRRADVVASALVDAGVRPDDRVAIAWPNSADFVVAYLGVLAAGAVAVPLNPTSPPAEIDSELAVVEPVAALVGERAAESLGPVLSAVSRLVVAGGAAGEWQRWMDGAGAEPGSDRLAVTERSADDLAVLLFTSGTAGPPKAAMLTHGNLRSNLDQQFALSADVLRADDVALAVVPMFHVFGLNVVVGLALAVGAALVPVDRFDASSALAAVADERITVLVGAPPMFAALARADGPADALSSVRLAVSGAAALPEGVGASFAERFGVTLEQGYGLTEASPVVATTVFGGTPAHGEARPASLVGRVLPSIGLRLVDESGEDVLGADPGEIWVHGDNVFAGYWRDEAATAAVLVDGWLRTGDVGVLDRDGGLHVVDRRKDVVIVSGFNVFPAEVEKVIAAVHGVEEVVVIGRPDTDTGEAVEAVVVVGAGADGVTPTEADIRARCRSQLAAYKCPATIRFVDALPHGLTGKALRRALRQPLS